MGAKEGAQGWKHRTHLPQEQQGRAQDTSDSQTQQKIKQCAVKQAGARQLAVRVAI